MIEKLDKNNLNGLLSLWKEYQCFYKVQDIDDEKNREHVTHILNNSKAGEIFVYTIDNQEVGFATLYYTFASTISSKIAILNDIYVTEECRGKGIGKKLLDYVICHCKESDVESLRWMTQESNTSAQLLYKNYVKPSSWLSYVVKV